MTATEGHIQPVSMADFRNADDGHRQYHNDAEAMYLMPNDTKEQIRLRLQQDCIMTLMHKKLVHSPVDASQVKAALDIGCGTGESTLQLAQHFPNARVYGIDLSPVPESTRQRAESFGVSNRVEFIEGNIFTLVGKHPTFELSSIDLVFHRFLAPALESFNAYLREVVLPLLRPGGWVEMHNPSNLMWFHSDPTVPGSATCVSDDWLWLQVFETAQSQQKRRDRFQEIVTTLQVLDFQGVSQKLYRLPWWEVDGQPETHPWAKFAPEGVSESFSSSVPLALGEEGMKGVDAQAVKNSVRETIGKPTEGLWWPFVVAWGKKPH